MPVESLLFTARGGALLGYVTAKAIRVVVKIAAVIIGIFVLVLAYLSYKRWIDVHWQTVADQTQNAASHCTTTLLHVINNAASTHSALLQTEAMPITIAGRFLAGLVTGFRY